jgi:O-methyltransferase involved in polyketide biosynthesis
VACRKQAVTTQVALLALTVALCAVPAQVVVVAAGFDTRAYRIGAKYKGAHFFEVDLPHASE